MFDRIMLDGDYYSVGAKFTIHICDLRKNKFFEDGDISLGDFYKSPLSYYPIWNESYRIPLNTMILDYFMMYEIGYETEEQFYYALKSKMAEIMPRYNVLFRARNGLEYNPLVDHDYTIQHAETGTVDTSDIANEQKTSAETMNDITSFNENQTRDTDTITRDSDTPQQNISNLGYGVDDTWINQWLTHGQIVNQHETISRNGGATDNRTTNYNHGINDSRNIDTDTTRNYTQHRTGRQTSGQELAAKLAELAYDIEHQLINDLKPLFMGLYES